MKKIIYADNAATTKLDEDAFEAMKPFLLGEYANPSQPYSFSRSVKKALKEARENIAYCINALPEEIYFTSGGTESDNWAIKGIVLSDSTPKDIITSQIEHHAILHTCSSMERLGHRVIYLKPDNEGFILPKTLEMEKGKVNPSIVSVMMANNEIGTIEPIKELVAIAHDMGAVFHTDAVQAVGHIPIDVKELDVDMLSASAHKFNGPRGIGFLYIKKGTDIIPLIDGGAQERGMRAGTENVAAIVGMAVALKKNCEHMKENMRRLHELSDIFINGLNCEYHLNGSIDRKKCLPGLISVSFKGITGEAILHRLDLKGICISTGSACDSVNQQVSHVIKAVTENEYAEYMKGTVRLSLSKDFELKNIYSIIEILNGMIGVTLNTS